MHDLLRQLYKARITLLAVVLTVVGLGLLFFAHWIASEPDWAWLREWPVSDIGSGLFTTGALAVAWQYFTGVVADDHTMQLFRRVLKEEAPDIRDAVIRGFAFSPEDLARVASPATIDQIVRNTLSLRLGDDDLAADVYENLRQRVIQSPERRSQYSMAVDLAPWPQTDQAKTSGFFTATVRCEYRVSPANLTRRFSCVSDPEVQRELMRDPTSALAWLFKPVGTLHGGSDEVFELVQYVVDGKPLRIRRSKQNHSQTYTVHLPDLPAPAGAPGREVMISYTYRVLARRHGFLYLNIEALTKGLKVAFRYGGCGIREVSTLQFIAGAEPARQSEPLPTEPTPSIEIAFDGWVVPRSGVAFVWTLDEECTQGRQPSRPLSGDATASSTPGSALLHRVAK